MKELIKDLIMNIASRNCERSKKIVLVYEESTDSIDAFVVIDSIIVPLEKDVTK